jgi:hypothetical protein
MAAAQRGSHRGCRATALAARNEGKWQEAYACTCIPVCKGVVKIKHEQKVLLLPLPLLLVVVLLLLLKLLLPPPLCEQQLLPKPPALLSPATAQLQGRCRPLRRAGNHCWIPASALGSHVDSCQQHPRKRRRDESRLQRNAWAQIFLNFTNPELFKCSTRRLRPYLCQWLR